MKIYTRTGDDGGTALFMGTRVRKCDARVAAYGDVDEANAMLGLVSVAPQLPDEIAFEIIPLMSDLFDLGAELATPNDERAQHALSNRLENAVDEARVAHLEFLIDTADKELQPLTSFVLPTGCEAAARLHVARTVVRRAERSVVQLVDGGDEVRIVVLHYLNRLSDLLFTWARLANHRNAGGDLAWKAMKDRRR